MPFFDSDDENMTGLGYFSLGSGIWLGISVRLDFPTEID